MIATDPIRKHGVTISGNPQAARTLLFVNGFGTVQAAWDAVARPYLDDYRIIRFDNAGSGRAATASFAQHRYLSLQAYADDLVAICRALELKDAIVVGHSVGAMIAVLASLAAPECFSRLVLIGASPRYLDEPGYHGGFSEADLNSMYREITLHYADWADAFAPLAMANPERPNLASHFAETLKTIPAEHALTVLCAIFQSDHRTDVARVDKPVLLIQSRQDVAVPLEVAEYLQRSIPGSRLAVIEATGHLPHVSAPAAVVAAIDSFL